MKSEDVKMPFGKHAGRRLGEILQLDAGYLDFLYGIDISDLVLARAVDEMNRKYEDQIEKACNDRRWRQDAER